MSINVKKYTKDQMAKMVEDAQAEVQELKRVNAALTEQVSQLNGEAITRENVIANLKADADSLRNKLDDTEAALGRANACIATMQVEKDQQTKEIFEWQGSAQALHDDLFLLRERGEGGIIGGIGRECYTQDVSMLCVCNYTEESAEREEKVSAPVVRNKRCRVTVGNRKLGSPSGDKNAAR